MLRVMSDQRPNYPGTVEDYTSAFLVSFGVLIFMALFAIWALWGLLVAGIVSAIADRLMTVDFRRSAK